MSSFRGRQVGAGWQRACGPDGDCWVNPFWEDGVLWVEQKLAGMECARLSVADV